jgi:hypothetical protein
MDNRTTNHEVGAVFRLNARARSPDNNTIVRSRAPEGGTRLREGRAGHN